MDTDRYTDALVRCVCVVSTLAKYTVCYHGLDRGRPATPSRGLTSVFFLSILTD